MFLLIPIIAIWLLLALCGLSACVMAGRADRASEQFASANVEEPILQRRAS